MCLTSYIYTIELTSSIKLVFFTVKNAFVHHQKQVVVQVAVLLVVVVQVVVVQALVVQVVGVPVVVVQVEAVQVVRLRSWRL